MANDHSHERLDVPCCPPLEKCDACDTLDFRYRLPNRQIVGDRRENLRVEVTLHFRLTRCPGPMALGDLIYSSTLFPGEQVRLFTSDRHSRFTFDSESRLAYRHETTSEESYFAAGMAAAMSDINVVESSRRASSFHESSVSGGGGAGIDLGFFEIGGSASASSYDASSVDTFARRLSQHAESSSRHMEVATRATSSTSVGEVQNRTHTQGESQDHFESSSRVFANNNHCHAVTYFFYRINKCQTLEFELVRIERRVDDPAVPTGIALNPPSKLSAVGVIPRPVLATAKTRLEVERQDRVSLVERQAAEAGVGSGAFLGMRSAVHLAAPVAVAEPIPIALRTAALNQVDEDLVKQGLLDKAGGNVSPAAKQRYGWKRTLVIPTPGVLVRGCLDECNVCEPELEREIHLNLDRKELENKLLARQIELLEKSQEYRCCPNGAEAPPE
jgi:hypothetical protein